MDIEFIHIIDSDINMAVPLYIMALYSYHESDSPIITDSYFGKLSKKVLDNWDKMVHNHKHKIAIEHGRLKFLGEYPRGIHYGTRSFKEAHYGKEYIGTCRSRGVTRS